MPRPEDYAPLVQKYARQFGLDPELVMKVIGAESSGNPAAVSPKLAAGLMQLMPATAASLGVSDPSDPEQNIRGGTQYLAQLLDQFKEPRTALAAYNFGPTNVAAGRPWPKETVDYVNKILGAVEAAAAEPAADERWAPPPTLVPATPDAMVATTRTPDISGLVADPDFQAYPLAERVAALQGIGVRPDLIRQYMAVYGPTVESVTSDPAFARFSPEAQNRILMRLVGPHETATYHAEQKARAMADASPAQAVVRFASEVAIKNPKVGAKIHLLLDDAGRPVRSLTPEEAAAARQAGKPTTFVRNLWAQ